MHIVIFGATGPTGREVVRQALDQGHVVTAVARNPAAVTVQHERLKVQQGNILDPVSVEAAVKGQEAVLSALGTKVIRKNTIISDGTRNIIEAMKKNGVRRLIVETSLDVGDSRGELGWAFTWIFRPLLLRNIFADKEVQERIIQDSGLDWVIVRPAYLTNGPQTGKYKVWMGRRPMATTGRISRVDVADFMLKQLTNDTYLRKTPGLSY
jgi:putative NADH-flavin reductase